MLKDTFIFIFTFIFTSFSPAVYGQDEEDLSYLQYLYPEFTNSVVLLKNGQTQKAMMNYNMATEKMVYIKDNVYYDLLSYEITDTIYINNSKFVPVGKVFYELVVKGPVTLFIEHSASLLPPAKPGAYGTKTETSSVTMVSTYGSSGGKLYNLKLPSDYKIILKPVYWIRKDYRMYSFVNAGQFLKIFPDKKSQLKEFIKINKTKFDKRDDVVKLINYCNSIIS
ncbi:MAG: hypothetical protein HPY62_04565 [Bacteroidales bacterium]|nr:hypothetical protein [Bacteroidales bacterium]